MEIFGIGILTGILAGYLASRIQKGQGSGCLVNLILGVVGAVLGSWLFSLFGFQATSWLGTLICAIVGAIIVLWIAGLIAGRRN